MTGLAEQELNRSPARDWLGRIGLIAGIVAALGLVVWMLSGLGAKSSAPRRQTVAIKVLPDTPPPPPPPKEDKPPPPKEEPKQVMQAEVPKVQAPQEAPPQLKMEGAAGDGPSAFAAGAVNKDYIGGPIGTGAGGTQSDRAKFQFFVRTARQQLKDELERHLKTDARQLTTEFAVWLGSNGAITRYEVAPTGSPQTDAQVKAALADTARALRLTPPPDLPQPLKFRLSLQPQG